MESHLPEPVNVESFNLKWSSANAISRAFPFVLKRPWWVVAKSRKSLDWKCVKISQQASESGQIIDFIMSTANVLRSEVVLQLSKSICGLLQKWETVYNMKRGGLFVKRSKWKTSNGSISWKYRMVILNGNIEWNHWIRTSEQTIWWYKKTFKAKIAIWTFFTAKK